MNTKAAKQIIQQLGQDPVFSLFFNTHFELKIVKSLRPIFIENSIHFPEQVILKSKTLGILAKLHYYWKDFLLWRKLRYELEI